MKYRTTVNQVPIGPYSFRIHSIESFEKTVDEMHAALLKEGRERELEQLCPYFGNLWPSGQALSEWIAYLGKGAFKDKSVLELGCGLALPSLTASTMGAKVLASDFHPDVSQFLTLNLESNSPLQVNYASIDWRNAKLDQKFDWILGSDILYEQEQADTLISFIKAHLGPNGKALILDPDRSFWARLETSARNNGMHVDRIVQNVSEIKQYVFLFLSN